MKAISTLVVILIILIITVAIAAMAYTFSSGVFGSTTETGSKQIETVAGQMGEDIKATLGQTCGNGQIDEGEICEIGDTKDCSEIGAYYSGTDAPCLDDCYGYDVSGCTALPTCTDTDGMDYYNKGSITLTGYDINNGVWTDNCANEIIVNEFNCEGNLPEDLSAGYNCPNGCIDGACVPIAPTWYIETVDTGDVGYYSSISLDSSDNPHISYVDYGNGDLKYAHFDGTDWYIETVDSPGSDPSISLDSSDNPHISYVDYGNGDLKYAHFDGTDWYIETVDSPGWVGFDNSISLDSSDNPHISYIDWTGDALLKHAHFDGTDWYIETVDSAGADSSISLDSSDNPHISYLDNSNGDLKHAHFDGTDWYIETVDTASSGFDSSISLDSSDNPHISYLDYSNYDLKYAHFDGTDWYIETVDYPAVEVSMSLDSSDNPHISYVDYNNGDLKYAYHDGTDWYIETVDSPGWVGYYNSMSLDSFDNPHISYIDWTDIAFLKYAHYE